MIKLWLKTAWEPRIRVTAIKVALVVGTILALINQSHHFVNNTVDCGVILRIALTYLVPYLVSTHAAVTNQLSNQ
jgi:hypothetical protein